MLDVACHIWWMTYATWGIGWCNECSGNISHMANNILSLGTTTRVAFLVSGSKISYLVISCPILSPEDFFNILSSGVWSFQVTDFISLNSLLAQGVHPSSVGASLQELYIFSPLICKAQHFTWCHHQTSYWVEKHNALPWMGLPRRGHHWSFTLCFLYAWEQHTRQGEQWANIRGTTSADLLLSLLLSVVDGRGMALPHAASCLPSSSLA